MTLRKTPISLLAAAFVGLAAPAANAAVFVNEIHYDNAGTDVDEAIELVATGGDTFAGYQVGLYNGSNGASYDTKPVPAGVAATCGGAVRLATIRYPVNGLQNGSPDGIALVAPDGTVVQFLSYEGQMTATNGPASGMTSTNLPVEESPEAPVGTSLQLTGQGTAAADFTWVGGVAQSYDACNAGQSFGTPGPQAPSVVSTVPTAGSTTFPSAGELSVTFSEAVTLQPGAFVVDCGDRGRRSPLALDHATTGTTFTIEPYKPLLPGAQCALRVDADRVTDAEGLSPAADTEVAFQVQRRPSTGGPGGTGYYERVNTTSAPQLRCSLHQTIRGHTAYPYSGSGTSTWTILEQADEDPVDPTKVLDVYRNRSYAKGTDRAGSGGSDKYNREHTWPNSLGFPGQTGNLGLPNAPYTDAHMLYLSDEGINSARGNKPLADCSSGCGERVTEANHGRGGGSGTYPGNSNWVRSPDGNQGSFEVWGARKGDIARAVLYMAIRYEGGTHTVTGQNEPDLELTDNRSLIVGTSSSPAYMGLLSTLLQWHAIDPPDAAERARNEVVFSYQGNRNPFIDHPEWATTALFTSTPPATCQLAEPPPSGPPRGRQR